MLETIKKHIDTLTPLELTKMKKELNQEIERTRKHASIQEQQEFLPKYYKELAYINSRFFIDIEELKLEFLINYVGNAINEADFLYRDLKNLYNANKVDRPMVEEGDSFYQFIIHFNIGKIKFQYIRMPFSTSEIYITHAIVVSD